MSTDTEPEVKSGLEGVVAFATEIAEPDKDGGALRYRGVDIEDLVGKVSFEKVWGLLVDGAFEPGMPPAEPYPLSVRSGDPRVDVQSALAMLAPEWGFEQLIDITDEQARDDLARASVMALSFVAQSARGSGQRPVPQLEIDKAGTIAERFLTRWRGEANPDHARAIDAYWISAAEHGMNASTFTARVVASTGADCAAALSSAVGALSGPLHGGAPARVLKMLDEVEQAGDADKWVKDALDRGDRLMGFGHRVYRAEDPRARVLRRTAKDLGSRRYEVAEALEQAALAELKARKPDRVLATNVEFWSAVILDLAEVPSTLFTSMFTCARVAGWSAHILEQKREARLIRPSAKYVGPEPRPLDAVVARRVGGVGAAHDVAQRQLIGLGQAGERLRGRVEALAQPRAQLGAAVGHDEHLHAAVVLGRVALDEAAVLEAVDDARDVRVVAVQRARELAHRAGLRGVQMAQRHDLRRRQFELGCDREEAAPVGPEQLRHQAPGLRRGALCSSGHAPMVLIWINR